MTQPSHQPALLRFERWTRNRGDATPLRLQSDGGGLTRWDGQDLDMIFAPLDGRYPDAPPGEYDRLIDLYHIPDEFVGERERSVTHSMGHQLGEDGLEILALWMHFLVKIPTTASQSNREEPWLKWGFVMTWQPKPVAPSTGAAVKPEYSVTFIAFQPPFESRKALVNFVLSPTWTYVNTDPYVLVEVAISSWYQRVDSLAWEITKLVREDEKRLFQRARMLQSADPKPSSLYFSSLDLHGIHTSAKNTIYLIEALDAILRAVDRVLSAHKELLPDPTNKWKTENRIWPNTHRLLQYRSELFYSTKLRVVSSHERIRNAVDLAFHLNNAQDSRINIINSRSVRIISIVGMIFIPFSAISSIFGTQFFSVPENDIEQHMKVNADFWYLFATAIPVTIIILGLWKASENYHLRLPARLSLSGLSSQSRRRGSLAGENDDQ